MPEATVRFSTSQVDTFTAILKGEAALDCLTCGICNSRCSWYDNESAPRPRRWVRLTVLGMDDVLGAETGLWNCLLCNRCTAQCPMGISMDQVVTRARGLAQAKDAIPPDLVRGVGHRLELGDVNALDEEDFIDTLDWLSEELTEEMGNPEAIIPLDKKGAKYLYLPNPREIGLIPMHLTAMARIFYLIGKPWTMAKGCTDVTNWGYFIGSRDTAKKMVVQVIERCEELEIDTLVLSECGHGYYMLKNFTEKLLERDVKLRVMSMPELVLEKIEEGVLKVDRSVNPDRVAYHDPCNIARKSGAYEAPRKLLAHVVGEVVELVPNRIDGICCGGGGGLLQDSGSTEKRMITGLPKVRQIEQAGVQHLSTACLSCHRQLSELSKHYKLGVSVETVVALVSKAVLKPE